MTLKHEELIKRLEVLKAEIEWDKSLEYQMVIDEALKYIKVFDESNELAKSLKEYSYSHKGEIAKMSYDASITIGVLQGRIKVLEKELKEREG